MYQAFRKYYIPVIGIPVMFGAFKYITIRAPEGQVGSGLLD
jgi:hypothetical protein